MKPAPAAQHPLTLLTLGACTPLYNLGSKARRRGLRGRGRHVVPLLAAASVEARSALHVGYRWEVGCGMLARAAPFAPASADTSFRPSDGPFRWVVVLPGPSGKCAKNRIFNNIFQSMLLCVYIFALYTYLYCYTDPTGSDDRLHLRAPMLRSAHQPVGPAHMSYCPSWSFGEVRRIKSSILLFNPCCVCVYIFAL